MIPTKPCIDCGAVLPLTDFPKACGNRSRDGYRNQCKTCRYAYHTDYNRRRKAADPGYRQWLKGYKHTYLQRLKRRPRKFRAFRAMMNAASRRSKARARMMRTV